MDPMEILRSFFSQIIKSVFWYVNYFYGQFDLIIYILKFVLLKYLSKKCNCYCRNSSVLCTKYYWALLVVTTSRFFHTEKVSHFSVSQTAKTYMFHSLILSFQVPDFPPVIILLHRLQGHFFVSVSTWHKSASESSLKMFDLIWSAFCVFLIPSLSQNNRNLTGHGVLQCVSWHCFTQMDKLYFSMRYTIIA